MGFMAVILIVGSLINPPVAELFDNNFFNVDWLFIFIFLFITLPTVIKVVMRLLMKSTSQDLKTKIFERHLFYFGLYLITIGH